MHDNIRKNNINIRSTIYCILLLIILFDTHFKYTYHMMLHTRTK